MSNPPSPVSPQSPPVTGSYPISPVTLSFPASPWKGLHSYREEDRARFFGRERETAEMLRLIQRDSLTVIFARSGMGKTSLLRAGVVPRLRESGFLPVVSRFRLESAHPVLDIITEIRKACGEAAVDLTLPGDFDKASVTLWEFFQTAEFWGPRNDLVAPVLIIDQFEEVFTLGRNAPATASFLGQLADLVENRTPEVVRQRVESGGAAVSCKGSALPCKVVLALREDFVPRLDTLRNRMPAILRNRFSLEPLRVERAREVILRVGSQWVEPNVADQILKAVAGADHGPAGDHSEIEPAYLSVMCDELFRRMMTLGRSAITEDLVASEQGNILAGLYNRSFKDLPPAVRVFVEDRLLTESGFRGTIPVAEAEAQGIPAEALNALVDRRLLRFEDRLGTTHVELSHDILTGLASASRERRRQEVALLAEREEVVRLQVQRTQQRHHLLAARALIALLAIALVGTLWAGYWCFIQEHSGFFRTFVKRNGFFDRVDPISEEQARHLPCSFKAYWKGVRWKEPKGERQREKGWLKNPFEFKPPHRVVAMNGNLKPTIQNSIGTYLWRGDAESSPTGGNSSAERGKQLGLSGVCQWEFVPDAKGSVTYERGLDRDGRMVFGLVYSPAASQSASQSASKRLARFVGANGFPLFQRNSRAEFVEIEYDDRGFEKGVNYRDAQNQPAQGPGGACGARFEFDSSGRVILERSVDRNGNNTVDHSGCCAARIFYNSDGLRTKIQSLGTDLQFMRNAFGWTTARFTYDSIGRQKRTGFYQNGGIRALNHEGIHCWKVAYDDHGRETERAFFDLDEKPLILAAVGYSISRLEFDSWGNVRQMTFFDADGKACLHKDGNHGWKAEYDNRGREIKSTWLGLDGKPMALEGYATYRKEYDARGKAWRTTYFDTAGKPCLHKDGNHGWEADYDDLGREIANTWLGLDEKPLLRPASDYATLRTEYDGHGDVRRITYFDTTGKPCLHKNGYHGWEAQYDNLGREIENTWLGLDDKPTVRPAEGYATYRKDYDERGNVRRITYFDANDTPCLHKDGNHGCEAKYDNLNREIENTWLGFDGKPIVRSGEGYATNRKEYDERGDLRRMTYFDTDGKPCLHKDGNHGWEAEYDERGREVKMTWIGLDSKPVARDGIATYRREFDARGRIVNEQFFNAKAEPCVVTVIVAEVEPDSVAQRLGIKADDVFFSYRNQPVKSVESFIQGRKDEDSATGGGDLVLRRNNQSIVLHIPPGRMGAALRNRGIPVDVPPERGLQNSGSTP